MDNNWRKKREIQHEAHNRKAGRAEFWKQLKARRSRRRNSRLNEWRVQGKIPTFSQKNEKPVKFKDSNKPILRQETIVTLADHLTPEQLEALEQYRD